MEYKDELFNTIKGYYEYFIDIPLKQQLENDIESHIKLSQCLILLKVTVEAVQKKGTPFNKQKLNRLSSLEKKEISDALKECIAENKISLKNRKIIKRIDSEKHIMPFIFRELNWIGISISAASYISSLILLRSVFELLINLSSKNTKYMADKIDSIAFLFDEEKIVAKKIWKELNLWVHPYGHWIKEICPIYQSHTPMYHKNLFERCIEYYSIVIDLFIIISHNIYEISLNQYKNKSNYDRNIIMLNFLNKRINYTNQKSTIKKV